MTPVDATCRGFFVEEVVIVNVPELKRQIAAGEIFYSRNENKKRQTFIGLSFSELERRGLIAYKNF